MTLFLITAAVFGLAFAGLAVGVILQGEKKELKGSCGGPEANPDCCQTCPDQGLCEDALDPAILEGLDDVEKKPPHPSLAQVPAASPDTGKPVATPSSR